MRSRYGAVLDHREAKFLLPNGIIIAWQIVAIFWVEFHSEGVYFSNKTLENLFFS